MVTYNIIYPFSIKKSQGGLFSAVQLASKSKLTNVCDRLIFHTADTGSIFRFNNATVIPANETEGNLPDKSWWYEDFISQHLQAYSESMIPRYILKEMYKNVDISAPLGSTAFMAEYFKRYPADIKLQEIFCARFSSIFKYIKDGDVVNIQGPAWFIPFIRNYGDAIQKKCKLIMIEHQLVPEDLNKVSLGSRLIPCYLKADIVYFHSSVYADRLSNMVKHDLPQLRTFNLGIDKKWIDSVLHKFNNITNIPKFNQLQQQQQTLVKAVLLNRNKIPHRFICIDRLDPMKGSHALICGIKMFLDKARKKEGEQYRYRYQFACLHQLWNYNDLEENNPRLKYIKICRSLYDDLIITHPGMVYVAESLTSTHRNILPDLIFNCSVIGHLGQEGYGLAGLESAYINRCNDTGIIVGNQTGFYLEAKRKGFDKLIRSVIAGHAYSVAHAIEEIVLMRELSPGALRQQNEKFVSSFVLNRNDTLILD